MLTVLVEQIWNHSRCPNKTYAYQCVEDKFQIYSGATILAKYYNLEHTRIQSVVICTTRPLRKRHLVGPLEF